MEKIDELKSKLIELSEKYAQVINNFNALITVNDATITDNNEIIADITEKIAAQEKLCNDLLDADIKIPHEKRAYKNTAKFWAILLASVGIVSSFSTGEFVIQELLQYLLVGLGLGGLSVAGYLFETRKERKLLKNYNYTIEYTEKQDLEKLKSWRQKNTMYISKERDGHVSKKEEYEQDLTQIQETLSQLLNDEPTLVNEPNAMTERCTQVMSLIREKTNKLDD